MWEDFRGALSEGFGASTRDSRDHIILLCRSDDSDHDLVPQK